MNILKKQIVYLLLIFPFITFGQTIIPEQSYYSNKQIKESYHIIKGSKKNKHGSYIKYFTNGKVSEAGDYSFGNKTEDWVVNYSNGRTKECGKYKDNTKTGIWYYFSYEGTLSKIYNYSDDEEIQIDLDSYPSFRYSFVSYPRLAIEQGIEGEVIISFKIDSTCKCSELIIVSSTDTIFIESALSAARYVMENIEKEDKLKCDNRKFTIPINYKMK